MKQAVRSAFIEFSTPLEGCLPYLYADIKNLITCGIGNLVDPIEAACELPFVHPDGSDASADDIRRAWHAVKNDPRSAKLGHRYAQSIPGNDIRLTPQGIRTLVYRKLDANDAYLARRYSDWEDYPADAQLAIHSLAWACGPAYRFPALDAAMKAREFDEAAVHITMNTAGNPGLVPRNAANVLMMRNAAVVQSGELDPETLYWPADLSASPPAAA